MSSHDAEAAASADRWVDLFEDHARRLRGLAAAITFDSSLADEIVQDAFAGLIERGGEVRQPEAYLQRSVINLAINAVRRRQRSLGLASRRARTVEPQPLDETWSVIGELSPQQRAVVVLRFYEDLSLEQIATVLDVPTGTVKSALHRALLKLKEKLS